VCVCVCVCVDGWVGVCTVSELMLFRDLAGRRRA